MSKRHFAVLTALLLFCALGWTWSTRPADAAGSKNLIYDKASLLSPQEIESLNALANKDGAKRETDIVILTTTNAENEDGKRITEDFYDAQAPGYDKPHGNAVILTMDMKNRQVYMAGFGKAETYLDDSRIDKIYNAIAPDLTRGDYAVAFERFITLSHRYMGFKPGVNPDNILFALWFQVGAAIIIGGIVVGIMVYRSGGRVTVNRATYENAVTSGVLAHEDQYLNTTITKTRIQRNNGGGRSGGGGGGGTSRGGSSHSGGGGSF